MAVLCRSFFIPCLSSYRDAARTAEIYCSASPAKREKNRSNAVYCDYYYAR